MVTDGEFFVSCGDAAAFLQVSEQAFDGVAFFIRLRVERLRGSAFVRFVSDHRHDAALAQAVAIVLRRATFVTRHLLRAFADATCRCANRDLIQRRKDKRIVARLAAAHQRRQWQQVVVTRCYELGRETAFRPAMAWSSGSPSTFFCQDARRRLVGFDDRAIDGKQRPIDFAVGVQTDQQLFKDRVPSAVELPKPVSCIQRSPFAVLPGDVPPGCPGFEAPQDAVDRPATVVHFSSATRVQWWQAGCQNVPLGVRLFMAFHQISSFVKMNAIVSIISNCCKYQFYIFRHSLILFY